MISLHVYGTTSTLRDPYDFKCRHIPWYHGLLLFRFAQRCGEVKTVIARSIDSSNQETVRELHLKLKALEKQNHLLEEQKAKLYHELENERHKRKKLCDPRTLSGDDKFHCKTCVQNLLTAAKETLQYGTTASNGSNIQGSIIHMDYTWI